MSQVQTQLKSGFAGKSAYSKNFLIAVLEKEKYSPLKHFQTPSSEPEPESFLFPFSLVSVQNLQFHKSTSCKVFVTSTAQFPTPFYLGQQLGHIVMHYEVHSISSSVSIKRSVHSTFTLASPHLTPELEPFLRVIQSQHANPGCTGRLCSCREVTATAS